MSEEDDEQEEQSSNSENESHRISESDSIYTDESVIKEVEDEDEGS